MVVLKCCFTVSSKCVQGSQCTSYIYIYISQTTLFRDADSLLRLWVTCSRSGRPFHRQSVAPAKAKPMKHINEPTMTAPG